MTSFFQTVFDTIGTPHMVFAKKGGNYCKYVQILGTLFIKILKAMYNDYQTFMIEIFQFI